MQEVGNELTPIHVLHIFQFRLHHTNFQDNELPHQKSNGKKHQETLEVTSFAHDTGAKRLNENNVVKIDHSPGWGSICCLGEEKWSVRKQLR